MVLLLRGVESQSNSFAFHLHFNFTRCLFPPSLASLDAGHRCICFAFWLVVLYAAFIRVARLHATPSLPVRTQITGLLIGSLIGSLSCMHGSIIVNCDWSEQFVLFLFTAHKLMLLSCKKEIYLYLLALQRA